VTDTKNTPDITDRELVVTRIIDAPRELVFKAWTGTAKEFKATQYVQKHQDAIQL
jgi:hypothetical protein